MRDGVVTRDDRDEVDDKHDRDEARVLELVKGAETGQWARQADPERHPEPPLAEEAVTSVDIVGVLAALQLLDDVGHLVGDHNQVARRHPEALDGDGEVDQEGVAGDRRVRDAVEARGG